VGEKGGEKGGCATYHKRATERGSWQTRNWGRDKDSLGYLTRGGSTDRKEYTMQAIKTSLIFLENRKWFCK